MLPWGRTPCTFKPCTNLLVAGWILGIQHIALFWLLAYLLSGWKLRVTLWAKRVYQTSICLRNEMPNALLNIHMVGKSTVECWSPKNKSLHYFQDEKQFRGNSRELSAGSLFFKTVKMNNYWTSSLTRTTVIRNETVWAVCCQISADKNFIFEESYACFPLKFADIRLNCKENSLKNRMRKIYKYFR